MQKPVLALVALILLAGCSHKAETMADATSAEPAASSSASTSSSSPLVKEVASDPILPQQFGLTGCLNPRMLFFIDPAAAQALLPPGYHAADASGLTRYVGYPLPPGIDSHKGVVGYDFLTCGNGTLTPGPQSISEAGVFIDPPTVSNQSIPGDTNLDLYLLALHSTSSAWQQVARAGGFAPNASRIAVITGEQTAQQGTIFSGNGEVSLVEKQAAAAWSGPFNGQALEVHGRYWHSVEAGTFYLDFNLKETVYAGSISSCTHAAGSVYAQMTGITTCGTEPRFAAVGVDSSIGGVPHWLRGVQPG